MEAWLPVSSSGMVVRVGEGRAVQVALGSAGVSVLVAVGVVIAWGGIAVLVARDGNAVCEL